VSVLKLSATLVGIDALACARLIERLFNYKSSILHIVFDGAGVVNNNAETS